MIKCSKCGGEVKDSSEFCPNCGNKLSNTQNDDKIRCNDCGALLNSGATFCPKCGKKVGSTFDSNKCRSCGFEIPENVSFCPKCGTEVGENQDKEDNVCSKCGTVLENDAIFCPNCGTNAQKGKSNDMEPSNTAQHQSFLDKIDLNSILKPTVVAVIVAIILSSIGVVIGLSWLSFIIAIILAVGFFTALMDNEANAIVSGLLVGLILGILENPIIQFWWGIYVAAAYEWLFGGQILLLIILGIICAYIANIYLKQNIGTFADKHLPSLLKIYE